MAKPSVEIPNSVFKVPEPYEVEMNPEYWRGYDEGKRMKDSMPGPAGTKDYYAYKAEWEKLYRPAEQKGFPISLNVGYNNCIADMGNWLWTNDPQSSHKVVAS